MYFFPCIFQLPVDRPRRAHRECLENGQWRTMDNSSDPWRDVTECKEDHYFKEEVRGVRGEFKPF